MEYRDHQNREKLRIEAEKARRTQWDIVNSEPKQSPELPQPIKVGKATTTGLHLEKKLRNCFGDFDDVRRYVVSNKDEVYANHAHIVGVTSYPATAASSSTSANCSVTEESTKLVKAPREKPKLENSSNIGKSNWLHDDLHLSEDDDEDVKEQNHCATERSAGGLSNAPSSSSAHSVVTAQHHQVKTEHGSSSSKTSASVVHHRHLSPSSSTKNKNRAHHLPSQTHALSNSDKTKPEKHLRPSTSTGHKTPTLSTNTSTMVASTSGNQALPNTGSTTTVHHHHNISNNHNKTQSSSAEKNRAWDLNRFLNTLPPSDLSLSNNTNNNKRSDNANHSSKTTNSINNAQSDVEKSLKSAESCVNNANLDITPAETIKKRSPERSKSNESLKIKVESGISSKNNATKSKITEDVKVTENDRKRNPINDYNNSKNNSKTTNTCKEMAKATTSKNSVADVNDKNAIKLSISKNKDGGAKILKKKDGRPTIAATSTTSSTNASSSNSKSDKTAQAKDCSADTRDLSRDKTIAVKSTSSCLSSSSSNDRSKPGQSSTSANSNAANRVRKKSDTSSNNFHSKLASKSTSKSQIAKISDVQASVGNCAGTIASCSASKSVVKGEPVSSLPSFESMDVDKGSCCNENAENNNKSGSAKETTTTFVDTLSPGKENYSVAGPNNVNNQNRESDSNDNDITVSNRNESFGGSAVPIVHRKPLSSVKHAEAIVEKSRLSPLLSPIHEFPSFEYKNGVPSLLCRLPLSLIKRRPPPLAVNSSTNVIAAAATVVNLTNDGGQDATVAVSDSWVSHLSAFVPVVCNLPDSENRNDRKTPLVPSCVEQNRSSELYSSSAKQRNNHTSASSSKDLDDVPISERRKGSKKIATTNENANLLDLCETASTSSSCSLVSSVAATNSSAAAGDSKFSSDAAIRSLPDVVRTSVENTINAVASSVALKKTIASLQNKSATKRKFAAISPVTAVSEPEDRAPPQKTPKNDGSLVMTMAPDKHISLDAKWDRDYKPCMLKAKDLKHEADAQRDKLMKILLYLESLCYFFLTGFYMEKVLPKELQSPYQMIKDTHDLYVSTVQTKVPQLNDLTERMQALFIGKIEVLSMRLQALLCFYMYWFKHSSVMANFKHIDAIKQKDKSRPSSVHGLQRPGSAQESSACSSRSVEEKLVTGLGPSSLPSTSKKEAAPLNGSSTPSPTPSPASSTGSSSHSLPPGLVAIPQQLDSMYAQQISYTHILVNSVNIWQNAELKQKQHDYAFFNHLDTICRPLSLTSAVVPSCTYLLTAVRWLRDLYHCQRTR